MKGFLRQVMAWKTAACFAFTGSSIIYLVIAALMGQKSVPILTMGSLLMVSASGTAIQYLCFISRRLCRWRYSLRLLLFVALFLPLLSFCAWAFHWFPVEYPSGWLIFIGIFLLVFLVMTAGFEWYYHITGRKYDGLLGQYKKDRDGQ